MRYHIDTIPVWDAMKLNGECPLCAIRRRNELIDADRFLGGSVMEPDMRVRVNAKGFCKKHQALLYEQKNKLGHALLMHSHLQEVRKKADAALKSAASAAKGGKRLFAKGDGLKEAAAALTAATSGCILCDSLEENMARYAYTLLYLYDTDPGFRKAFAASKGVCLPDASLLLSMAGEALSGARLSEFVETLQALTDASLARLSDELEWFTVKFDYRNANKPWGESKDALERTVNKMRGYCVGAEPNPKEK